MMTWKELKASAKIALIGFFLLLLYVGSTVLQESVSVFDYGRF